MRNFEQSVSKWRGLMTSLWLVKKAANQTNHKLQPDLDNVFKSNLKNSIIKFKYQIFARRFNTSFYYGLV